jgi:hypothetical protein
MSPQITSESIQDISTGIMSKMPLHIDSPQAALRLGHERAAIINAHLSRLIPVMDTNTVSSDLKRTVILQQSVRAFAARILMLTAFSSALGAIKLEGTDQVAVPYFSLDTVTSNDWNPAVGYNTFGDTNSDSKLITIDKRKWLGLKWTSSEFARQPFMSLGKNAELKTEQLAKDVVNDVLSLITAANFGASVKAEPSSAFDSNDVVDLKTVADTANWPTSSRSLILDSTYDNALLKDNAIKNALNWGDNQPVQEGRIFRISGFDYFANSYIPTNGEHLKGFIVHKSAILFAQGPVAPTAEVRRLLSGYEVVVEPTSGAAFEFRSFGNATLDQSYQTMECNYGFNLGEVTALKRVTDQ